MKKNTSLSMINNLVSKALKRARIADILALLFLIFISSCGGENADAIKVETTEGQNPENVEVISGIDRAFQALRNRNFITTSKELKLFYKDGSIIYKPNCKTYLIFNNDSLVVISDLHRNETRPSIYRVREVTKEDDPYFDDQPKHYIAEFYTSEGELVKLTFAYSLDFENQDPMKQDVISVSSKILDFNLIDKIEEMADDLITDPFSPNADRIYDEFGKKYVGERRMQKGFYCQYINYDYSSLYEWTNPVPFRNIESESLSKPQQGSIENDENSSIAQ